ncbi:MAG TPA: phosphoenolpyruvate--protein phosphotransferase [Caulobacteraceae bacterium]|nr:phosphoenolpyruvate--protein phosphotransferase [Caulobacteraceae bacterium]
MSELTLISPLAGWVAPLDEAPDPVFAERMMGDGVLIDPTSSTLCAPCDGEVVSVHHTRHAVTLRATGGAEILMHIGLETVALKGEGFTVHVQDGQAVRAGDPLIGFDLDYLALHAASLVTPIILANSDSFAITRRAEGAVETGRFLMAIAPRAAVAPTNQASDETASRPARLALAHGLHARPAASVAACAKRFSSEVSLSAHGRKANAKSVVSLMAFGARDGDALEVLARGADAQAAAQGVADHIAGLVETAPAIAAPTQRLAPKRDADPKLISGVTASPGLAVGIAVRFIAPDIEVPERGAGVVQESAELARARGAVRDDLEKAATGGERHRRSILAAHIALLDDPELLDAAQTALAEGRSAGAAWRYAVRAQIAILKALDDARMAERAADLADLERQVLLALVGEDAAPAPTLPEGAILIADELLPSQLVALDASKLAGFCLAGGGPTSHVAIIAASMDIPAVVAAGERVLDVAEGTPVILDADQARLHVAPEAWETDAIKTALAARKQRQGAARKAARELCTTADGKRIEVFSNLGAVSEAAAAVEAGAEGCGLLRTEFLFLERDTAPDEAEQKRAYQAIADALGGRHLIVRTLDIGGDKPVAYLPLPYEDNPALGLRGVRTSLWRPDLMREQLRAILGVEPAGQCSIMLPMIAQVSELKAVRAVVDEIARELGRNDPVKLGVMVETPACAVLADQIGQEADFFSIGTNDLTQYALAMDRGSPQLAAQLDALHPAVLRLIGQAVEGASKHGRWVGVCGGLASDPIAAPILIGLGVTELSATPNRIPDLKALIRQVTLADCRKAAVEALTLTSAAEVRALVLQTWPALSARE